MKCDRLTILLLVFIIMSVIINIGLLFGAHLLLNKADKISEKNITILTPLLFISFMIFGYFFVNWDLFRFLNVVLILREMFSVYKPEDSKEQFINAKVWTLGLLILSMNAYQIPSHNAMDID